MYHIFKIYHLNKKSKIHEQQLMSEFNREIQILRISNDSQKKIGKNIHAAEALTPQASYTGR